MPDGHLTVSMPHMGVSIDEGTVVAWHKCEGEAVRVDDLLCEVVTDKVDTEIRAPVDGVLVRRCAATGETVKTGDPVAELAVGSSGARRAGDVTPTRQVDAPAVTELAPAAAEPALPPSAQTTPAKLPAAHPDPSWFDPVAAAEAAVPAVRRDGVVIASPVARRFAAAQGIALEDLAGSGIRGRIRKADVLTAVAVIADGGRESATGVERALPRGYDDVPFSLLSLGHRRRSIAEHMVRSRQTAAHMTTEVEVDMHAATEVRADLNRQRIGENAPKMSYLPLVARSACAALLDFPSLNATFDDDRLLLWNEINLGIAVDAPKGLIVPVIRGCERLATTAIGDAILGLAERARTERLVPDDLRAGTFTISNPGSIGATSAMAIINQPQVAILGMPAIVRRPVVTDDGGGESIAIRPMMTLALTFDHRAIDGADATRFLVQMKSQLEHWDVAAYV